MAIELTPEIKELDTWDEAQDWLARHGWGTGLIEQQKAIWDEANTLVVVAPEVTPKVADKVTKPVATATE